MLTKEQIQDIKKQLLKQIEVFPEDKRENAKEQIEEMDEKQLEEFLNQNSLIQNQEQQNPFRLIVQGKIPSHKVAENENALAVLEINPISKAHTIIISKNTKEKSTQKQLAKEISEKIKQTYKPKKIEIYETEILNEKITNILPIYDKETKDSKRKKLDESELKKIQKELTEVEEKPKEKKSEKPEKAPVRIP